MLLFDGWQLVSTVDARRSVIP